MGLHLEYFLLFLKIEILIGKIMIAPEFNLFFSTLGSDSSA